MSAPAIRGWCPGAHRPMAAGDGLVVRVRPPMGELSPVQAHGLAGLAKRFGNGFVELTNRGNLQLRGVDARDHLPLIEMATAHRHRAGLAKPLARGSGRAGEHEFPAAKENYYMRTMVLVEQVS